MDHDETQHLLNDNKPLDEEQEEIVNLAGYQVQKRNFLRIRWSPPLPYGKIG